MKQYNFYQMIFFLSSIYRIALNNIIPSQAVKKKFNIISKHIDLIEKELRGNFKQICLKEEEVIPEGMTEKEYLKEIHDAAEKTYDNEVRNVSLVLDVYVESYNQHKTNEFIKYMQEWK